MSKELRDLHKQERHLHTILDKVHSFVEDKEVKDVHQVQVRMQRLDTAFKELLEVRRKIELLTDDIEEPTPAELVETPKEREKRLAELAAARDAENEKVIGDLEEEYCDLQAKLRAMLPRESPPVQANHQSQSRVKLPEIQLPSFNGDIKEWIVFRDTFTSAIHNNPQLSDMDKFTYLRLSLVDNALLEISNIEFTADNYSVAWSTMETTYENKKLIVEAYLDSLFAVEPMEKECFESLNRVVGEFDRNLMMLNKVGEKTANWSTILVHLLCSRLDVSTLRNWEAHHKSAAVPEYADLIKFLREECAVLQSVASRESVCSLADKPKWSSVCNSAVQSYNQCPFCSEPFHFAYRCLKFLKMCTSERLEIVQQKKLCFNCLSPGHQSRFCTKSTCHHCHQKHHSLLHPDSSVSPTQNRPLADNEQQLRLQQPQLQNQPPLLQIQDQTPSCSTAQSPTNAHNTQLSHTLPPTTN